MTEGHHSFEGMREPNAVLVSIPPKVRQKPKGGFERQAEN